MILRLGDVIDDKMLDLLAETLSTAIKQEEPLHIYMCSEGGSMWEASAIIDLINRHAPMITLSMYGQVLSAAVHIFAKAECTKRILPGTFFMIHSSMWTASINETGTSKSSQDIFKIKHMKDSAKSSSDVYKLLGLSNEELKKLFEGEDIYLDYKRLKKTFKEETK